MIFKNLLTILLLSMSVLAPNFLAATTIQPYSNLGELALFSDHMVMAKVIRNYEYQDNNITYLRTKLVVEKNFKGDLQLGQQFDVQKWEKIVNGDRIIIWGDTELYEETSYLLFLNKKQNGTYEPICFSYYLFEEITRYGETFLVPSEHAKEFETLKNREFEPLKVYHKEALLQELENVISFRKEWQSARSEADLTLNDFYPYRMRRGSPSHCTFLTSGGVGLRWENFDTPVAIRYTSDASTGCDRANDLVQACVSSLNSNYPGVSLIDGGQVSGVADCSNYTAVGSNYRTWMDNNLGSNRNIIVQYEDPCDEFPALNICSGVIAIGGLYKIGEHTHDGSTWNTAAYGYVVINEGATACFCKEGDTRLADILEHELSHALGLGHIASSAGTANMNPVCCNDISNLDQNCVDYAYPFAILPVELSKFEGEVSAMDNVLTWETAYESGVEAYYIERSSDLEEDFDLLARVESKGDTQDGNIYDFTDKTAGSKSYYRLRTIDFDGSETLSEIIPIERPTLSEALVYPTRVSDQLQIRIPDPIDAQYTITSATGEIMIADNLTSEFTQVSMTGLSSGWYYVRIADNYNQQAFKVLKD